MRFEVLSGDTRIGWSELEFGDPPMGVAHGRFYPSDFYRSSRHAGLDGDLRARPEGSEEFFKWQAEMESLAGVAEVIIGKQRHGPTGTVNLQFDAAVTRFDNLARDAQAPEQM